MPKHTYSIRDWDGRLHIDDYYFWVAEIYFSIGQIMRLSFGGPYDLRKSSGKASGNSA